MSTQKTAWTSAFSGYTNAKAALAGATDDKDLKRKTSETLMRTQAAKIQANPAITAVQKEALGVTVRKTTRTPVPVPSTTPALRSVDTSTRARLGLHFADAATPDSTAKPPGVGACEIREQIGGTAPLNPDAMACLASDTRSPYLATFPAIDVGKTVWFALRWVNTRGEHGPWSQLYPATVPG